MKTIGMIGIGLMGHGIASNLLKGGYPLTVLEHPGNQPLDSLKAAGAKSRTSARAIAAESDVVILCVTGSPQVEAVMIGEDGVLAGIRRGAVILDCSTAVPSSTERLAAAASAAGARMIDAPMTRTAREAAEGRLNLLVGADAAVLEELRPVLACFAENITHVGPVGAGHRMKLLHNYVSLGTVALIAEAAACALRAGIDAGAFVDVLAQGGGQGIALERLKPYLLNEEISLRFAMSNAAKDLDYYNTMARESGSARSIGQAVMETYRFGTEARPNSMVPELVSILRHSLDGEPRHGGE
jgi:3-hydroxyisobutyrate dehydrogenase-like beta-hydroxyacid dehydrogenase